MTSLSPAAEAVYHAYLLDQGEIDIVRADRMALAAALRAAADCVVPKQSLAYSADYSAGAINEKISVRHDLLAIAAELDYSAQQS
jgi:hypothetical protein